MTIAVGYVLRRSVRGDYLGVLFLLGGLLAGALEPMLDHVGLLWFADDNVAIAVTTFHRFVPLYVVLGYAFYFGGLSYVAYRAMLAGRGQRWFWGFFAIDFGLDFALQATGHSLGLYTYYGPQPFMVLGVPLWWIAMDCAMPVLTAGTLYLLRSRLRGLQWLIIIPLVPSMYAGINAGAGWPVFSVLNSDTSTAVAWLGGTATICLALLTRAIMLSVVEHEQQQTRASDTGSPAKWLGS